AQIAADTADRGDGGGIDVVLNSLAGDFVGASLGLLRDGGRFLEIGKSDHLTAEHAAVLGRDIQYHVIDWSESARAEPQLIRSMIDGVVSAVAAERLRPLPVRAFDIDDAQSAFRFMAQARHIGKVVVVQPAAVADRATDIRGDASYLVTGGLSGLGLLTAQHLAARGARHLILLGRRSPGPDARAALDALEQMGVAVAVCTGDVSSRVDVQRALDMAARDAPLRGVFHSAGALDDATIGTMTWEQVTNVLAAKVDGALLLDELTRGAALDLFVMYASIASLFGSRGQANHAAANAYLDALAHRRVAEGRPGLSIDWGAWSSIGAAADRGVDKLVGEQGIGVIAPDDGLAILDLLLERPSPQVGVSPVQWPLLLSRYGAAGAPPYFAEVAAAATGNVAAAATPSGHAHDLASRLAAVAPDRRGGVLLDFVRDQAAHVLALSVSQVGDRVPLSDLGLDSLMAVELRNVLGAALGHARPIPATLVFDYPTVEAIAGFLGDLALGGEASGAVPSSMSSVAAPVDSAPGDGTLVSSLLDDLENLTDEEIDAQLARRSGA
ncbi:MAG: SDR family NAD(P)-dependent oxidoreductase, partial [Actinomycetota bacterium]|nr:SDR family NAD(P)-dependent oxidoreductase [Actinomycetota bacterium]